MYGRFCPIPDAVPFEALPPLVVESQDRGLTLFQGGASPLVISSPEEDWTCHAFGEAYGVDLADEVRRQAPAWAERDYAGLRSWGGNFVFVFHRPRRRALTLIGDRFANRRLYFALAGDQLFFFPRLHYFKDLGFGFQFPRRHLLQFLTFRCIFQDTILASVERFPPAGILDFSASGSRLTRYWNWDFNSEETATAERREEWLEELSALWSSAIDKSLGGRAKLALFLSGGLDSRAILGELLGELRRQRLKGKSPGEFLALTYGIPGTYDFEIARLVAEHCGVPHRAFDLSRQERDYEHVFAQFARQCLESDGMVDLLHAPNETYRFVQDQGMDVATGYLSDVLSGAYVTPAMLGRAIRTEEDVKHACWSLLVRFSMGLHSQVPALLGCSERAYLEEVFELLIDEHRRDGWSTMGNAASMFAFACWNCRFAQLCITKGSERLEYVHPFADGALADFWQRIPPSLRCEQRLYKEFLRRRYPDLFALPIKKLQGKGLWDDGKSRVLKLKSNAEINILDYAELLRTDAAFAGFINHLLSNLKKRDLVDAKAIDGLWREHREGGHNHFLLIMRLASLEMIFRCFGEGL